MLHGETNLGFILCEEMDVTETLATLTRNEYQEVSAL